MGARLALSAVVGSCVLVCVACGGSDEAPGKQTKDAGSAGSGGAIGDAGSDQIASCGNGIVESGEGCDEGTKNGPNSGCENNCQPSCSGASDCDDQKPCNGAETCEPLGTGKACKAGTPLAEDAACGTGGYCKAGVCTQPTCGNGDVEPTEACDPPNPPACSATCQICGDGKIGAGEHCDDGNKLRYDGCDANCRYETVMRVITFEISGEPAPSFCKYKKNAYGAALSSEVRSQVAQQIASATDGGTNNIMLDFVGLDDLSGKSAPTIKLGVLAATLDPRYANQWVAKAMDAWFAATPNTLDSAGDPITLLDASIDSYALLAGPGPLAMQIVGGTTPNYLEARDASFRALIDQTPLPNVPKPPPAGLASGLTVFQTINANGTDLGLCGALTVESLAKVVAPPDVTLGAGSCNPNCSDSYYYTYCGADAIEAGPNCASLLDPMIGGCKLTPLCIPAIVPTQPDVGSNGNPPATLTLDSNNKAIPSVPTDGYSFYVRVTANRTHLTNNLP